MKTLRVNIAGRGYPILVGTGLLTRAGAVLSGMGFSTAPSLVSNPTVLRLHGHALLESLESSFGRVNRIVIGDGERYKNRATLSRIHDGLFQARADRDSWILAFGGGVVGDIAGFAAATFMRGIPVVNVPTTLLAQVDSAIGGKVGINVPQGKNLIGAFHQPRAVLSDPAVLRTLPHRELAAGLYEVIKCAAIRSVSLLHYIEGNLQEILTRQPAALEHIIVAAARIKAHIVAADEKEKDLRMVLNFGHTIGHALEAATSYRRFRHGEAVAWGMIGALGLGMELGFPNRRECARLVRLIDQVEPLPSLKNISFGSVWASLKRDKKFRSGQFRMVLLPRLGEAEIHADIDPRWFRRFLKGFLLRGRNVPALQGTRERPRNSAASRVSARKSPHAGT